MRENLLIYEIEAAAEQTEYDFKHKMMYRHFQGQYFEKQSTKLILILLKKVVSFTSLLVTAALTD